MPSKRQDDISKQLRNEKAPLPENAPGSLALPGSTNRAEAIARAAAERARVAEQASKQEASGHDLALHRAVSRRKIKLDSIDPDECGPYTKSEAKSELKRLRKEIEGLQERLYAEGAQSLLVVLQAIDGGGKDGTIRHVFQGVNPQGCQVWPFKVPTPEELAHDFLWRCHARCPARGMIAIFNRSYYEDVLVARVKGLVSEEVWRARYSTINDFERMLALNNTIVLKFFLYISKDEQKERFQARLDNPDKTWKFSLADLPERARWDSYMEAYEDAVNKCASDHAPWYVVPANKKWYRNLVVARVVAGTLASMDPQYPRPAGDLENVTIP